MFKENYFGISYRKFTRAVDKMKVFILKKSGEEFCSSHSGLTLVGACINRFSALKKCINDVSPRSGGICFKRGLAFIT
jgi:hypothetical protein